MRQTRTQRRRERNLISNSTSHHSISISISRQQKSICHAAFNLILVASCNNRDPSTGRNFNNFSFSSFPLSTIYREINKLHSSHRIKADEFDFPLQLCEKETPPAVQGICNYAMRFTYEARREREIGPKPVN